MLQEFIEETKKTAQEEVNNIHTVVPGEIVSFDASKCLATVQPKMKFRQKNGETIDYPEIGEVPVVFLQTMKQEATIAMPIKAGDGCLIVFSEQSLDYWQHGQETDTDLKFDLTNAICIPGLFSKENSIIKEACDNNAIIVDVKGTRITVKKDNVEIESKNVKIKSEKVDIEGDISVTGKLITTEDISTNGDVKAGATSLNYHVHTASGPGSPTTPPVV